MKIYRRSKGVIEAQIGKMWLRLTPNTDKPTYRLTILRKKDNGFTSARLNFELENPNDLGELALILQHLYHAVGTAEEVEAEEVE